MPPQLALLFRDMTCGSLNHRNFLPAARQLCSLPACLQRFLYFPIGLKRYAFGRRQRCG